MRERHSKLSCMNKILFRGITCSTAMDLDNIGNMVFTFLLPSLGTVSLLLFLPFYLVYKLVHFFFSPFFYENMSGKVVLITGASAGIGEHVAYQYAKKGASLVLSARREQALKEVADNAQRLGSPGVLIVPADVSKHDDCENIIKSAVSHFGRLDHLVANAGITSYCLFERFPDITKTTQIMDVNFWGSVYPAYYAIPHLRKNHGKVVVIASVGGWVPTPRLAIYSATKAALIRFFETIASELRSEIKVTIATPGYVETDMTKGNSVILSGKPQHGAQVRPNPLRGKKGVIPIASAEDCAKAIVDGACRGARYVTWPSWYGFSYLIMFLAPEVWYWLTRKPGRKVPSNRNMDISGDSNLNPASITKME